MDEESVSNSLMGPLDESLYSSGWSAVSLLDERRVFRLFTAVRSGRRLVIKTLRPEYAASPAYRGLLEREASLGVRLDHPGIVRVDGMEHIGGIGPGIVMERVDGSTLSEYLQMGDVDVEKRRNIACELAEALAYAHEMGVSHRDLKPDNVMVTRRGHVKVIDFGLGDADDFIGGKGSPGSRSYGAPEQQVGPEEMQDVDFRADVWSFGRLLKDLDCGRRYGSLARRCMLEDPDSRPSMQDVADRLGRMQSRPLRWPLIAGAVMMVAAFGAVIWTLTGGGVRSVSERETTVEVPVDTVVRIDSVMIPVYDTVVAEREEAPVEIAEPVQESIGRETPEMAAIAERAEEEAIARFRQIYDEFNREKPDPTDDYDVIMEAYNRLKNNLDQVNEDFERKLREAGFAEYRIREIRSGLMLVQAEIGTGQRM